MRVDQIALQLYTVRRLLAEDLDGTLAAVAAAGYRNVEIAGIPEADAERLPAALERAGLTAVAAHVGIERLRSDLAGVAAWLNALACPRLVVPSIPETERGTPGEIARFAAELNRDAERLVSRGIALGYHNHAFEFAPLDGTTIWEVLRAELAEPIELELDVYWASVGGRDPVEVLRAAGDRVRMLHMKDRAPGPTPHDAPAGQGTLAFPEIVGAGRDVGVEWYIAEQDEPGDVLADIRSAYDHLRSLA